MRARQGRNRGGSLPLHVSWPLTGADLLVNETRNERRARGWSCVNESVTLLILKGALNSRATKIKLSMTMRTITILTVVTIATVHATATTFGKCLSTSPHSMFVDRDDAVYCQVRRALVEDWPS